MKELKRNKDMPNIIAFPEMNSDIERIVKDSILQKYEAEEYMEIKYKPYFKWSSFSTYYLIFKSLVYFFINYSNQEKITSYEIDGINLGIPILSSAYRSFKVYDSKLYLFFRIFLQIILSTREYINSIDISSKAGSVYITDISYRKNILFDICMKKNIKVFTKKYPYSLVCFNDLNLTALEISKIEYPKIEFSNAEYEAYMMGRLKNPKDFIPYYSPEGNSKLININKSDKLSVLIYAHSFTDTQLISGYDGFLNVYDWIEYTIDNLLNKNVEIIIKGHPNFWAEGFKSGIAEWDMKIWKKLIKKYDSLEKITIIDFPVDNIDLLQKLDVKKTIVMTHHSNALVEAAYLGYKSVSSSCCPWGNDYYSFGKTWGSRIEYKNILENLDKVKPVNKMMLKNFVSDTFMNKYGYFGEYSWSSVLANDAGITTLDLIKEPNLVSISNLKNYKSTVTKIANNIQYVH